MKKCVIIMNPKSGKKKKIKSYHEFYDIGRKHGYDIEIILTKEKGDGERIVQELENRVDLVISAGGDGTLNEIVSGNIKREKPLTVSPLPMGSTNDVGNMYGLDKSIIVNLETILKGKEKKVDVCFINDTPFVYVACLGDYIDMAYATPRGLKEKFGNLAYVLYGIKQLRNKINQYRIRYKVNGEEHIGTYSFFFISNSSRIAGQPDVYYDVKLDDNKFEVAFANVKTKKDMLRMFVLVDSIDVKEIPGITYYQTNDLEIEFLDEPKSSWCIDGEEYKSKETTFKFRVERKMKMQVPRNNITKLFE